MKCGIVEILKLVQDSLEEKISRASLDKILQFLIDNDSVKSNSVSNRVCLSIPFYAEIKSSKSDLTPSAPYKRPIDSLTKKN